MLDKLEELSQALIERRISTEQYRASLTELLHAATSDDVVDLAVLVYENV